MVWFGLVWYGFLSLIINFLKDFSYELFINFLNFWGILFKCYIAFSVLILIHLYRYELERLKPVVTGLCRTIANLPVNNSKQRLSQSEIAKKVSNPPPLIYKFVQSQPGVALFLGKREIMIVDSTQQIFHGIRAQFCEC